MIERVLEKDPEISLSYFDVEGQKMLHKIFFLHQVSKGYDWLLNLNEQNHLGLNGKLTNHRNGDPNERVSYATETLCYDSDGNLVGILYFDANSRFIGQKTVK